MIKIDAEGFDMKVFAGASELVGKTDIFLIEVSILDRNNENALGKVIQTMTEAGYRIIDITAFMRNKNGVLWLCEVAFLRNQSRLFDRVAWD